MGKGVLRVKANRVICIFWGGTGREGAVGFLHISYFLQRKFDMFVTRSKIYFQINNILEAFSQHEY